MPRVLFVGSHCDDCEWMAGGTAILLARAGAEVHFLCVIRKPVPPFKIEPYLRAAKASARILGVRLNILPFSQKNLLRKGRGIFRSIRSYANTIMPDIAFIGPPQDYMLEHTFVARCTYNVLTGSPSIKINELYAMESPACPFPSVDFYINTTRTHGRCEKALLNYRSIDDAFGRGLAKTRRGLSLLRGEQANRVRYAEGFRIVKSPGTENMILPALLGKYFVISRADETRQKPVYPLKRRQGGGISPSASRSGLRGDQGVGDRESGRQGSPLERIRERSIKSFQMPRDFLMLLTSGSAFERRLRASAGGIGAFPTSS